MKIRIRPKIESAIVAVLFFAAVIALRADTITVTNTNDSGPGSLRQALSDANDGDTITFAVAGTIGLTSGELLVNKSITISGPGADSLAVNGNAKSRVFHISSAKTVTISGLTITNGMTAGPYPNNYGGGIYNDHATLTATNCVIDDNFAEAGGAGIFNDGSFEGGSAAAEITNTTLRGNSTTSAGGAGGAIYNFGTAATLIINSSTISGNSAGTLGGGIYSDSLAVTVQNSTLSGNSVGDSIGDSGGGIVNFNATLTISNSTFSDNSAYLAGAIHNSAATLLMGNTVLKTGPLGVNIVNTGTGASQGYNLSSDDGGGYLTGPGDQINTDPLLGTLQNNGGPTLTHELLPGSPAIDTGNPSFTPPPFNDQRGPGFDRVVNGRLDIGSFEVQSGGPTPTPTPTPSVTPSATPTPTTTPRSTPTPRPRPAPRPRPTPR